jgi:predicted metal-dependent phosphoesterase TrpH/PAS domain-containing protein
MAIYQEAIRIDFHSHSTFSDGAWDPEAIAKACAENGIRFAALTDHNTLDGLDRFEAACERHGVGFISGLELLAFHGKREIHLLCYGFDRTHDAFAQTVKSVREAAILSNATYALVEKKRWQDVIRTVHLAGGIVLLAHPLLTEPDPSKAEALIAELAQGGLDGVEVCHPDARPDQQSFLRALAGKRGLVVSGGTDHHGRSESLSLGVEFPAEEWKAFREALVKQRKMATREDDSKTPAEHPATPSRKGGGRMRMLAWMALPAVSAVFLLTLALFGFFLPGYEKALMDRKREMIRELASTVWSMLDEAVKNVQSGRLSPGEARAQMVERVRALRYGREGKDYFWLQDLTPRILMHPYRPDLEGQDLSDFEDPRGVPIFKVFADKALRDGDGYVDYVWQWKDDPSRLEAKECYIRLFEPWGWVIGTGLYINDVVSEINVLKRRLLYVMGGVIGILILLLLVMLRSGLRADRLRAAAEMRLQEANDRYLSLVRASEEGVLFVRHFRCVYANPVFLELAGCGPDELPLLEWQDLFPGVLPKGMFFRDTGGGIYMDALLRRREGSDLKCRIAHKATSDHGVGGFMVLVRRPEEGGVRPPTKSDGLLKRLLNLPSAAAEDIAREITAAGADEQVIALCRRVPGLAGAMLESGASSTAIAGMITAVTDSATGRFIELALAELGPAPVAFAFVALGSQGRQEQTLFTDQDNAIVYETPGAAIQAAAERYFEALASRVCKHLTESGYRDCKGLVMASNPKWCQPVEAWKHYFTNWISRPEEHEMMEFGTFFDIRCVKGDDRLVQALRSHIRVEVGQSSLFFSQAARTALLFKSPLRLFGNIVATGSSTDRTGQLDLKKVTMPIVSFARVYALKENLQLTATQDRLSALSDRGLLLPSQHHDIATAFDTLLRLRLRHQTTTIQQGGEPNNLIDPASLGHLDEAVLNECFKEIDRLQERINRDFLGGQNSLSS